ncbi:MAG: PQQ-binding-like beta-propeller repeat protein [Pirellulales bacterium]|nr:PQQ-binding-like beta-propeller repeat protein [Pirellulales bacterium]
MKRSWPLVVWSCLTVVLPIAAASAENLSAEAGTVLKQTGVRRGICAVLGDNPMPLAIELARASELLVYVQLPADKVEPARRLADQEGLLGSRIFVEQGASRRLHLADNLADTVVAPAEQASQSAPTEEILRVLRPGGKAVLGPKEIVKPLPEGTDDWSHPYHGPDNNPQSKDRLARAPYLTHFLAEPWYSPMPLVTVASGGRLFKAFGHIAIKQREWPLLNTLVAQNAFNGTVLWQRKLSPKFMIHRSAMIATPDTLFLADDTSCKLLDAATGELRDEIVSNAEDGAVWKWIALSEGVLYALVGKDETPDPTVRGDRKARGWPWGPPLGQGYNSKRYPWGFGQTILAIDPASKKVLWRHRETDPLDARAMAMAAGRIFFYSHASFLGALNAKTGEVLWRTSEPGILEAIGEHRFAQNPTEGFSTSTYLKCNDMALYFAGPTRTDLVAVSASDGKLLWRKAQAGNSQLVLRDDGLYAMGPGQSTRYDYLTGEAVESLGPRVNCTRATGSADSIFVRGGRDGTMRYDLLNHRQQHIGPMRPSCQDGVLVAHGHLYWGPWMCDCNLTLVGVVCVAPAGEFDFTGGAAETDRTEVASPSKPSAPFEIGPKDWPTLRANNARTAASQAAPADQVRMQWTFQSQGKLPATAPTAAGGLVFVGWHDGAVRAFDAAAGDVRWTVYTGGPVSYPPSLWEGRAFVGSGDGWIYCLEAATGKRLWRFRAAPADRIIPVYGSLRSTWPVASGVLVEDGVAYAAAGIANYDGTHVYALDARTGKLRWHNHSSGSLDPQTAGGVSVSGHLLLNAKRLHMAGGNIVQVAGYDLADGKCLSNPFAPKSHTQFTAGSDLFVVGEQVIAGGPPLYSTRGDYRMVNQATLQTPLGDLVFAYGPHDARLARFDPSANRQSGAKPRWESQPLSRIAGVAVTPETVVAAGLRDAAAATDPPLPQVVALSTKDGSTVWSQPLAATPAPWGVLVDRDGRTVVTLQDGQVACFAAAR